jgi:hypothetical protein
METTDAQVTSPTPGFKPKNMDNGYRLHGDKKPFKKKPSPEERHNEEERQLPKFKIHATGFVSIHPDLRGDGVVLRGLYVPGVAQDKTERFPAHLRNRIIILAKSTPAWVMDLCKSVIANKENLMIRVNVTRLINENLCIAYPCAKSAAQVRAEWKRRQSQLTEDPKTIHDCQDYWAASCFVHERVARERNLTVLKHDRVDSPRPHSSLAVNESGAYFTISGGDDVYNFAAGILNGVTTMQKEIGRAVKINRYYGSDQAKTMIKEFEEVQHP